MTIYLPIAELSLSLPMLLGLGLAVGVISGMFGIGGGFLLTPMLIFLGIPPAVAVGTGASQVIASSVSGALAHWQRGNVDRHMGWYLIGGGLTGVTTGIKWQQVLKALGQLDLFTTLAYAVVLGVIGSMMLIEGLTALRRQAQNRSVPSFRRASQHNMMQRLPLKRRFRVSKLYISTVPLLGIGLFVGWLTAIMGVGGGFLLIPALIYVLRVPTRIALGTSSFQIIFVTIYATLLQAMQNFSVDLLLALPLMIGGVLGAQVGVRLGERLSVEQLRTALAALVLAVAVRMSLSLVLTPSDLMSIDVLY